MIITVSVGIQEMGKDYHNNCSNSKWWEREMV